MEMRSGEAKAKCDFYGTETRERWASLDPQACRRPVRTRYHHGHTKGGHLNQRPVDQLACRPSAPTPTPI